MSGSDGAVSAHCCDRMRSNVAFRCEQHPDPYDCPDNVVVYVADFQEYGLIIHDGGTSYLVIANCPWCVTQLPPSKRPLGQDSAGLRP